MTWAALRYLLVVLCATALVLLLLIAATRAQPYTFWCAWMWNPFEAQYVVASSVGATRASLSMLRSRNMTIQQWADEWVAGRTQPPLECRRQPS